MPLYLSEELSPRFSRAKQTRGWNERRLAEQAERVEIGRLAVEAWEAGGRDRALKELVADDSTGLEGVSIRSRTRQEVRDAAMAEYDEELSKKQRMLQHARKMGLKWERQIEQWETLPEPTVIPGGQQDKAAIKRDRKDRRAERLEQKLEDLKLEEGRNMVLPADLRL
jgi:large subunit ribosomal protein L24